MSVKSYSTLSEKSYKSQSSTNSNSTRSFVPNNKNVGYGSKFHGSSAWWSVGEYLNPGLTHQSVGLSLAHHTSDDDVWDLSDSLADLYAELNNREQKAANRIPGKANLDINHKIDVKNWIAKDTSHGFIRIFNSESEENSKLYPSTLSTTAQKICSTLGIPSNSLHIQLNGDIIRRLEPFDCPLAIQNEFLTGIGYTDILRVQEEGSKLHLCFLIRFYAGKPISDSTYSRNQLTTYAYIRKGKLLHQWVRRYCIISGTRLLIYRDKNANPTIVQLAKGSVEEVQVKGQGNVLKLTSTLQGERSIYISFIDVSDYNKWLKKAKKATSKLPTKADLSNCHLEFLPETVFINDDLQILILRHNALKERPIEEDIYTIGWLDDLPRFLHLTSLNLADNSLYIFPQSVCRIRTLVELNMASNKLEDIPVQIADLVHLQALHLHNNRLASLPEEIGTMKRLLVVVLAFNRFTTVPNALLSQNASFKMDSVIMAGNQIERLPMDNLSHMKHIKKIDLRMNKLELLPTETAKFHSLDHVTHLDIRDNHIVDLDIRAIRCLEYLNCERSGLRSLQINGSALKNVFASHNNIQSLSVNPKPEWLISMDVSHNKLTQVPNWLGDCFFLVRLDISHNCLDMLPDRIMTDSRKLKILRADHNRLKVLPSDIHHCIIEELHLEHNEISDLPPELFIKATKLRYLNLTRNNITDLPTPNRNDSYNKIQELYLMSNNLNNKAVRKICCFPRLRVLHLANNNISELVDKDFEKLEQLQELNISFNNLRRLPACLGRHPKLQSLRVNCNLLHELPNFKDSSCLKVLEVGTNHLENISMGNLMTSKVNLLDISGNPNILVNTQELDGVKHSKRVCMIDMRGQNRSLENLNSISNAEMSWQSGFSHTSGMRNKLSVAMLNRTHFSESGDALFGVFDGGRNDEIAKLLAEGLPSILQEEQSQNPSSEIFMKYTLLSAHRNLKSVGQKLGAAAAVVHIKKTQNADGHILTVANVGDTEVILARHGEAVCLSRIFLVSQNSEECQRIIKADGIITEDGRVSGVTFNTRLLGCGYLYPQVIPNPHVVSLTLTPEDQLIIIANQGLWRYVSYQEAVKEIVDIPDPVIAAKRLQDLAQGCGSRENIGILVVRLLLSEGERFRMQEILRSQFEGQKQLLETLKQKTNLTQLHDVIPAVSEFGGIVIDKTGRVRKQSKECIRPSLSVKPTPNPNNKYRKKNEPLDWEAILQRRLAEEVKDKQMKQAFGLDDEDNPDNPNEPTSNWSTLDKRKEGTQSESNVMNRRAMVAPMVRPPQPPPLPNVIIHRSVSSDTIESFDEFTRQPVITQNIDRDAILFHQMQMARAHSLSSSSLDSTQSDPLYASVREVYNGPRAPSRSIEVLVHSSDGQDQIVLPSRIHRRPERNSGAQLQVMQEKQDPSELDESEIEAIETDIMENFHISIEDLYARVMKKKQNDMDKDPSRVNLVKFTESGEVGPTVEEMYAKIDRSQRKKSVFPSTSVFTGSSTSMDEPSRIQNGGGSLSLAEYSFNNHRNQSPTPPPVIINRTASQQSIIITYL
ncbi:PH domain leucine-rich repeat-containing protein phosphatase 2-like [Gigantopelta aegis]|uniref:PH domain leucine-rich repeat-containing protein phosphatase 2-like n=1 Tax=Gigantopelta aegis TaxID=1735272 RepID=UPI001B88D800|nr:PH domain leucine-rich repeat-containing protein phosphatase 2-like [Gigantopelta aegis]XP_041375511.1 PH domain leucine-rich repeat-containing protein phosphatase 2-like [Gigantopelta aegis]